MPTIRLPIHLFQFTPLREGRQPKRGIRWQTMNFNSRPSARGDINRLQASQSSMYFNSRPSARGDAPFFAVSVADNHFNSRPSARGDSSGVRPARRRPPISIHAPPRGATHQKHFEEENTIFQFTPLREGRHRLGKRGFSRAYFNSRPSARGDRQHEAKYAYRRYFNSRPSARGDPQRRQSRS